VTATGSGDAGGAAGQMGKGVKQRDKIRMTDEEIAEFLRGKHTMSLASINADGSIHLVAMWYGFLEGEIAFETKAKSQKVQNLRRNPNITCMVETGDTYNELKGVQIIGTAEIFDERDRLLEMGKSVFERHVGTYTDDMLPAVEMMLNKRVVVKVAVDRVVSWDHRKLGLPSTA
jgi:PPOX class probable F420-dependent enzyme